MTVKELMEILEHEVQRGRGDFKVIMWDTYRLDIVDTIRDSREKSFYLCTEN